jgi:hypothetical protein
MRTLSLVLASMVLPLLGRAEAQITLPATTNWDVEWRNPEGHVYTAEMELEVTGSNVEGFFNWTLRASPRAEERAKIGLTGVEYIRGTYDPDCGLLLLEGKTLDDPNRILGMDQYRIVVSPDVLRLAGMTGHGGEWTGEMKGNRR